MELIILVAACVCAYALPEESTMPRTRNTIFGEEKLGGAIFEHVDTYEEVMRNAGNSSLYRLPTTTKPRHYNVKWFIDINKFAFEGDVGIVFYATQVNVSEIVIHADDMKLTNLVLTLEADSIPVTYVEEKETQFLRVKLKTGSLKYAVYYTLSISFNSKIRVDMYGIYRSWFKNIFSENVRWMASTQFKATAARWAFPCYDEPAFKATFDISILRPVRYKSWSCTNIKTIRRSTVIGFEEDVYDRTPVLSTYQLAFIVAEYDSVEDGFIAMFESIGRPGAIRLRQGDFSASFGNNAMEKMTDYTQLDYFGYHTAFLKEVTPKLMMFAAIPDLGADATENWGLPTFREAYMMYDEKDINNYFRMRIASSHSHVVSHMWFGNLVTCDWWDVLWLNEGFATYFQYVLTDWVESRLGTETHFITDVVHTSLLSDSANNPQQLTTTSIGNRASVSAMFSTITHNKGAAVIRMTEHLLGSNVLENGLIYYLRKNKFYTVLPSHLFNELQRVTIRYGAASEYGSGFSIIEYYKSWTEQPGHPVLNVQVNYQTGEMTISQRRFNINTGYHAKNINYIVPITFATACAPDFDKTKPTHVISQAVTTIHFNTSIDNEWVVFNKKQTGYYRVNYDDYTWDLITLALRKETNRTKPIPVIHEYNRAQIVDDVFQFARSGLMTYTRAFTILSFLEFETEYAPWVAAIAGFNWVRNRLVGTAHLSQLESLMAGWTSNAMKILTYFPKKGYWGADFKKSNLRYQLAPFVCNLGVQACRDSAYKQFRELVDKKVQVPVNNRNWVYCNGLREGSAADWQYLWTRFQQHNVYTEKIQLLMVLGCTTDAESLNTFLENIVAANYVIRRQDYTTAWNSAVSGNEANTLIVFEFTRNNLKRVIDAFGSASTPLYYISSRLRTENDIKTFQRWATENKDQLGGWYSAVYDGAELSRGSIQWAAQTKNDFINYLENGNKPLLTTTDPSLQSNTCPTTTTPYDYWTVERHELSIPPVKDTSFKWEDIFSVNYLLVCMVGLLFIFTCAFGIYVCYPRKRAETPMAQSPMTGRIITGHINYPQGPDQTTLIPYQINLDHMPDQIPLPIQMLMRRLGIPIPTKPNKT